VIRRARFRLTATYAAIFIAMLVLLGGVTYLSLRQSLTAEVDRGVQTVVDAWLATAPDLDRLEPIDLERRFEGETADVFLLVFRADGALVANPSRVDAEEFGDDHLVRDALQGRLGWDTVNEDGVRFRLLAAPVWIDGDRDRGLQGVVVGGRSLAGHERQLQMLIAVLGVTGLIGLVLAAGGGWVLAGRALQPIALAYERQRAFVSDASHELRSPLAVIRAGSDLLLRDPLPDSQREAVEELRDTAIEASTLVDDLLELARLERGATSSSTAASDLRSVAASVAAQMRPLLEAHGTHAEVSGPAARARIGEPEARRVIRALLENVLAHTPAGTPVNVETAVEGTEAILRVTDRGPGAPAEILPALFERFTRADISRTPGGGHSGLGLAIVAVHIERAGGRIAAHNQAGGGLRIEVRLPLALGRT
jgi:two-component system, OmpR family, sensor histidine kinase CiaH